MRSGRLRLVAALMIGAVGFGPVPAPPVRAYDLSRAYYASTDPKVAFVKSGRAGYGVVTGGIKAGPDGRPEVRGLYLNPSIRAAEIHPHATPSSVFYPPLRAGDLIPGLRSQVCQVDDLVVPGRGEPSTFSFHTVRNPPDGTALQPGGWAVPVKASEADFGTLRATREGHYRVWVDAVAAPKDGPKTADLTVSYGTADTPKGATVRTGDVLFYTGFGYRVVNVVPKDPKTRVIGWVEFDPKAFPTEEEAKSAAVKSGGKVVVPKAAER